MQIIKKYKSKQETIEAIQMTKENVLDVVKWIYGENYIISVNEVIAKGLAITTLKVIPVAEINDYVIKDAQGEFYTCEPNLFEAIYENTFYKAR